MTYDEARARAESLGDVVGSSISRFDGAPVAWAFDIDDGSPRHIVLAGAALRPESLVLGATQDHVFAVMRFGKALFASAAMPVGKQLTAGEVVKLAQQPEGASWFCDSFLLCPRKQLGLCAVGLHLDEIGRSPADTLARVRVRTPALVTSPDPHAREPDYATAALLVRRLRRIVRLRELDAPAQIIDNDLRAVVALARPAWLAWPDDLRAIVDELAAW